ncbi:rho guanine nucleotide exchange factor 7-like isoform X3 [Symsagittifera roscoffensis]|uniref:rho guanine nucleotide exchange factor 7-like isoform X3 n=1 Tax=Symsagittifera roscoffensis TaxID=84072 RepID=UPI00307B5EF9
MSSQQTASAVPFTAKALYNFVGNHEDELQFRKGDYLTVLQVVDGGWWEGQLQGHGSAQCSGPVGWFPANHIKIVSPDDLAQIKANPNVPKHVHSSSSPRENTMHSPENTTNTQKTSHYSLGLYSLLESQMRFEDSLNNLLEKSLIPLGNSNILSAKDYDILCCNLHEITQLVKTLTKELTDACKLATSSSSSPSSQQGGKFAKQMCSFLSRYRNLLVVYCANHPLALRVISNHSSQLDSFAKASRSSLGAPASSSPSPAAGSGYSGTILDLTAAFSQPFRQIETYSGILREIKASISDSHPDYNQLTEAIRLSDKLVNELEEVRGLKEREMEILSARMDNWPRPINDPATANAPLSAIGPVLSMAAVWTTKPNSSSLAESYLLMFTDYVVIVQPTPDPKCYKCQHLIEMRELVAHAKDPASDAKSNHSSKYPLILIDQDGERYSVLFRLNQQRAQWVKMIGDQSAASSAISGSAALGPSNSPRPFLQSTSPLTGYPSQQHNVPAGSKGLSAVSSHARLRSSAAASHPSMSPQPPSHHAHAVSRPPPFMRNERSTGANHSPSSMGAGRCNGTAVTTGGFDITQLRPNPPMTPSELILCARQSNDAVKSPKVSRKKSNRKSEKIRAEELAELNSRKTLDCRSLDHDAKIFEVIEAYCQSSQNRMTLHSGYVSLPVVIEK